MRYFAARVSYAVTPGSSRSPVTTRPLLCATRIVVRTMTGVSKRSEISNARFV